MFKIKINLKNFFSQSRRYIKNPDFQAIILIIFVAADTLMIASFLNQSKNQAGFFCSVERVSPRYEVGQTFAPSQVEVQAPPSRALDGVILEAGQSASTRPFAVVIENYFQSRPASGLAQANLVYEFLTEGGITRYLALYDSGSDIKKLGPIRSCRPYFLDIASEFGVLFAHVGGSQDCLKAIASRRYNVYDLDEYSKTAYFWRSAFRSAPHNVYTSVKLLNQYLKDKKISAQTEFTAWKFKEDEIFENRPANKIFIDFSLPNYYVEWRYNPKDNDYFHYLARQLQQDTSAETIKAKNIIIQYVSTQVLDSAGRLNLKFKGQGGAHIFQDGQVYEAAWKKPSASARTIFYDNQGEEIEFNRGITWVEVLPTDRIVTWSWE